MNKKVVSIIAIIALVAILGVCLVACNANSYAKKLEGKGYDVETMPRETLDAYTEAFGVDFDVKWGVAGTKGTDMVAIYAFANADDAESFGALLKLVACNADSYVKKLDKEGYDVQKFTGEEAEAELDAEGVKWMVVGLKMNNHVDADSVVVVAFDNADDAKAYADVTADAVGEDRVHVSGKVVIVGSSADAVKDVKAYADVTADHVGEDRVYVSGKVVIVGSSADAVKDAK